MRINDYGDMNLQELDVMKEIGSIGTSHAATSLSQLLQKEVQRDPLADNISGDAKINQNLILRRKRPHELHEIAERQILALRKHRNNRENADQKRYYGPFYLFVFLHVTLT